VLKQLDGNKTVAAGLLGLDRRTLYRKLERWGATHDAENN
jgi:DNA-binding protein Fis